MVVVQVRPNTGRGCCLEACEGCTLAQKCFVWAAPNVGGYTGWKVGSSSVGSSPPSCREALLLPVVIVDPTGEPCRNCSTFFDAQRGFQKAWTSFLVYLALEQGASSASKRGRACSKRKAKSRIRGHNSAGPTVGSR